MHNHGNVITIGADWINVDTERCALLASLLTWNVQTNGIHVNDCVIIRSLEKFRHLGIIGGEC